MWRICVVFSVILAGCATSARTAPAWPHPTDTKFGFTLKFEFPEQLAIEMGLPPKLTAKLDGTFHAEAISVEPIASKYTAVMSLNVSDDKETVVATHTARIEGTGNGGPSSQLTRVSRLYTEAWTSISAQIAHRRPTTGPTTRQAELLQSLRFAGDFRFDMTLLERLIGDLSEDD